jgi:hypothetical protein
VKREDSDTELPDIKPLSLKEESQPPPAPDPLPSDSETDSEAESDSGDEMTDVIFSGKSADLPRVIAHCTVKFLSRATRFTTNVSKSAYLASTFRGAALEWLSDTLDSTDDNGTAMFADYDTFKELVQSSFQASAAVQRQTAERRLQDLRQNKSALQYSLEFLPLAKQAGLGDVVDDDILQSSFRNGLKSEVQKALIGRTFHNYSALRTAAIDVDESLYAMRPKRRQKGKGATRTHKGSSTALTKA